MYNKEKIKKFHEYTLKDYNEGSIIEDIAKVNLVEKTDGYFRQLGTRFLIDEDIFIDPSFSEYLPGAGRRIAIGEEDFLIKNLLNNDKIEKIAIGKKEIADFPKYIDFNEGVILLSTKFYVEIFTELMHRIDYEEKHPQLDKRYRIISVPEKVLGNKIILIGKDSILWKKEIFDNKITENKEKIDIDIKPTSSRKADVTIRSVNKISFVDEEEIKVLEIVGDK